MKETLINGAAELGLRLSGEQAALFSAYLTELKKWNKRINLTSITTDGEIVTKHFLDSLIAARHIGPTEKLLDMGAGGGFPGLPLKIAMPEIDLTLMDSVGKKVNFMRHVIRTLALTHVRAVHERAGEPLASSDEPATYDCVISRAFSSINDFLRLALPYLTPGGRIIAMKGPKSAELTAEIEEAGREGAFGSLISSSLTEYTVPFTDRRTSLVIFKVIP